MDFIYCHLLCRLGPFMESTYAWVYVCVCMCVCVCVCVCVLVCDRERKGEACVKRESKIVARNNTEADTYKRVIIGYWESF